MTVNPDAEPLFEAQWHLENSGQTGGTPGIDINAREAWDLATGAGVTIAINDTGISSADPDVGPNVDTSLGGNFIDATASDSGEPDPAFPAAWHGTAVAGMAGSDDNGTDLIGAAPDATLASLVGLGELEALARYADFDVVNASWGFAELFGDDFSQPELAPLGAEIEDAAEQGRDGRGTVMVFAAGNDFTDQGIFGNIQTGVGDANYHNFQNSRHTIAVGALDDDGTFSAPGNPAGFTTPGAPVLVSAPGTEVLTRDLTGELANEGDGDGLTVTSGTSFAAPLVSGVGAQMLEANPDLGWRDVQEILAYTARRNDPDQGQWRDNGADTWNGGGLHTNPNYGFGLVDAAAAVRLAASWRETDTSANEAELSAARTESATISASRPAVEQTLTLDDGIDLETVAVDLNLAHERLGDVTVTLTSPGGTTSVLIDEPDAGGFESFDRESYRVTSNEFHGESSGGTWTLRIADGASGFFRPGDGVLFGWALTAYGSPADGDDVYVYTDEYGETAANDPARRTLSDPGGTDDLNAAATSAAVSLDLTPGATSTIDGRPLTIAADTDIENAFGGGGDDSLRGNALANTMAGGPGADSLRGGAGDDRLAGGRGADRLEGGAGTDTAVFDAARGQVDFARGEDDAVLASLDGITDMLFGIELASFSDAEDVLLESLLPPLNTAPVAQADRATALAGEPITIDVLTNDRDADGDDLSVDLVDTPANGSVGVGENGLLTYTPAAGFTGRDAFTYSLSDGQGGTDTATVALDVVERGANVFLADGGAFAVFDRATAFGRPGSGESLYLADGARDVTTDANLEELHIPRALSDLSFAAGDGGLAIAAAGSGIPLATVPSLNQPMRLRLADGDLTAAQTGATSFTLTGADGGTAEIDGGPATVALALGDDAAAPPVTATSGDPAANVFLGPANSFAVATPAEVFGRPGGDEGLVLAETATGVRTGANLERLDVPHALDTLTFEVTDAGLSLRNDLGTLVSVASLNQPMAVRFADGSATLTQTGAETFTLAGDLSGTATIGPEPTGADVDLGGGTAETVALVGDAATEPPDIA